MQHDCIDRLDPVKLSRKEVTLVVQHPLAPPRARRALLLALAVAALLALVPAWRPLPAAGAAAPTITVTPDRGPCGTQPAVSGSGFPAGAAVDIYAQRTDPSGGPASPPQRVNNLAAGPSGGLPPFTQPLPEDCADGTQYTIIAAVGAIDSGPTARAVFTVESGAESNRQCFAETGQCIEGRFLAYWRSQGLDLGDREISARESLALFGYPISGEFTQTLEDGKRYTVQYFERARFEYHPENTSPYDVLLGHFGRRILASVPGAPTAPVAPSTQRGYTHFRETDHNVAPDFALFWSRNGGLAVFGYPLSEEFTQTLDDVKAYTVQYFERARFERHAAQEGTPYNVQLGQFGRAILGPTGGPTLP